MTGCGAGEQRKTPCGAIVKKAGKRLEKYRCGLYISSFWRCTSVKKLTEVICVPDSAYQSV